MNKVIVVVGPTASGKSSLAIKLAQRLNGEIVSADSMQVYRGMNIGSAKAPENERIVDHWGLDLLEPGEPFSAALFQVYARSAFKDIFNRGKTPILCGGTGFYVRAAIDDYDFPKGDQIGNDVRDKWMDFADKYGAEALWNALAKIDPNSAQLIAVNDIKRIVRAFELLEDGKTYAQQKETLSSIPELIPSIWIGLEVDPQLLKTRINTRVDKMIELGLVAEVESLLDSGFREAITASQAIGYKEIVAALDGKCSMDDAIEQIKTSTRRYAKRQRTWFRKEKRIHWIDANNPDSDFVEAALKVIAENQ
mgnify:FL=1